MRPRTTAAGLVTLLALGAAGCGPAGHEVGEVPGPDTPTPETTPFLEPVSPPAEDIERPSDENGFTD